MWYYWIINIIFHLLFGIVQNVREIPWTDPLVQSKVGLIRGLRATDGNYSMFLGIPYATVNTSNPFGPSSPHSGFNEVFEAYDDSAICPQVEEFNNTIVGTLECLHVNIYVPDVANTRNLLPVLVYIYGGEFMIGFSSRYLYGPRFFVNENVIFITLNYRVGPYGFMCLETPEVPGNQGLKDQQLALKWIKDNIEAFGGDSSKITICGNSSGGSSVDFHLIYSKTKTFDKVIMQSGTALYPWAMAEPDRSVPLKLAKHLGIIASNVEEALAFMSKVDSNLLIAATKDLGLKFRPCVEKEFDDVENFIYEHPVNLKRIHLEEVPILLGCNSDEALAAYENILPEDYSTLNLFHDDFEQYFNFDADELNEMEEYIRHFYIGDEEISSQVKQGIVKLNSDFYFNYPVARTVQKYLDSGARQIYYYLFAYSGKRNFLKDKLNVTARGASHADELGYLFDISYMDKNLTPEDELIISRISKLWTNFVKFGNPTPEITELLPVKWPTVTKKSLNYLYIDSEFKVKKRYSKSRMTFWDLFYRLNERKQVGYQESDNQFTCPAFSSPHPGFEEVFEAYDDSAICPQVEEFNHTIVGTLDCLHLNIYVPNSANSRNSQLSVLVWIYGGAYRIGFSGRYIYGPRYFMKQDIILVTLNYRLGPYGFICLDTPNVPGNQGLKDQKIALKWIKENIDAFGGNSDRITIYGESAGASSIEYHLIYSQEKVFDKIIMQSGAALCPWALLEPDTLSHFKLTKHFGFRTTDTNEALIFLSTLEPSLVITASSELGLVFSPCVEKEFDSVEKFIYDHPVNIKQPRLGNVPILLGHNSDESLVTYESMASLEYGALNLFYDNLKQNFNFDDTYLIEMEEIVRHFYIGDENISEQEKQGIIEFSSDFLFIYPVVRTIQKYLNNGNRNIYYYVFSYDGQRNFVKSRFNISAAGASHADEIGYFFDISYINKTPTPKDQMTIDRVTTLWANFVKFGNPSPEMTQLLPIQWPAVTEKLLYYLSIDSDLNVKKRDFTPRIAFWDLFYKLNEKAQIGYVDKYTQSNLSSCHLG